MVENYQEPLIIQKKSIEQFDKDNLKIRSVGFIGQLNLRLSNPDFNLFSKYFNINIPKKINTFTSVNNVQLLFLGPDEFLLICPVDSRSKIIEKIKNIPFNYSFDITDVSFNRVVIEISGKKCDELILSIASIPKNSFIAGSCIQSQMANTQVIMMCLDDNYKYKILVRSSFSEYFSDVLIDQADFI
ncbi:MAG: hypothetical protein CFH01_00299 [Alphaproteobacteria bacterium MarineAlpha2_Bin1]|nr:MAG: hypothetical protein CFH01_00299 [Alphaproteobacteria bacterium MarineAlpha2_Bin1]